MPDLKVTELTATTTPVAGDLLPIVTDNDTTPITKKITYSDLIKALALLSHNQADSTITLSGIGTPTYGTLDKERNLEGSAVVMTGGGFTDNSDGTIIVAAGSGEMRATDSLLAPILAVTWAANNALALTDGSVNYIYLEYNAGTPQIVASLAARTDLNTNIFLGTVYLEGTLAHTYSPKRFYGGNHSQQIGKRLQNTLPFARESGGMLGEIGTRNISVTAGIFWEGLDTFITNAFDSSDAGRFSYYYRATPSGWTKVATQSQIDNTYYDDNSGTLVELTVNRYGVHWVFLDADSHVSVVYGQGDYTLALAQAAKVPASIPPVLQSHARLIGKIIIQKSAAVFISVESAFIYTFEKASIANHNDLSNIDGGSADQYYHLTSAQHTIATQAATAALDGYATSTQITKLGGIAESANNYVHPNHSGEVTSAGDGATTIADNAVTLAKLATQATNTVLANATAESAVPTAVSVAEQTLLGRITGGHIDDLSVTQVRTLINVADGATANTKATGAEINTSEDDAKFATAKAIADSNISFPAKQETLTNKTLTSPKINEDVALTATATQLNNLKDKTLNLGASTSYTPTLTNVTLGTGGTKNGYYTQIGKMVFGRVWWTYGTSGANTGSVSISLPVTVSSNYGTIPIIGQGSTLAGGTGYPIQMNKSGVLYSLKVDGTYGVYAICSATVPITFANGDQVCIDFVYEAA